jgi:hypothetical protein
MATGDLGRLKRAAALLWAAPGSLIGLIFCPFFKHRHRTDGILLCEGAGWPRRLGWRYRAITFGHVVLSIDELDPSTLEHEMRHVRQYERWGVCMLPAYLLGSLWAVIRGGHYYRDNPFERSARDPSSRL